MIFKKDKKILNYFSIIFFGALAIFLIYILILALTGNAFSTFVTLIKPFSNLVPISSFEGHVERSLQNGYDFFDEGEAWLIDREDPDASGFSTLNEADQSAYMIYVYLFLVIGLLVLLIYFNFRKKKPKHL